MHPLGSDADTSYAEVFMTTKEKLAHLLENSGGAFVSGNEVADSLGITRAAIWKNVQQLQKEGYRIEAIPNKGYRLDPKNDVVSEGLIASFLGDKKDIFTLEVHDHLSSTNTVLKEKAANLSDWHVMIAGNQTSGKGRSGRSFFSPEGTGLYLSVLLRPDILMKDAGRLTTAAAVAACRAIEEETEAEPKIKWVNDVFAGGKKVCGILTEASVDFETGLPEWVVTGIGFNVYEPEGGFPNDLKHIAGAIVKEREKNLRARLAAAFLIHFHDFCADLSGKMLYREYKSRCFILGKNIDVIRGEERIPAIAEGLKEDFSLRVRYGDGTPGVLNAGEVSIRPEGL